MKVSYQEKQLFYTDEGSGPVVVLLHGFLENHKMWGTVTNHLKLTHRLIKVDLPGHGKSEVLEQENTMQAMADAVAHLLKQLKINTVALVGHSMGGYVALAFAKAYPALTTGVFLLNSTPHADSDERKQLRKHGIEVAYKNYTALVSMSVSNLFSKESNNKYVQEIEATKTEALKTPLKGYIACQEGMMLREDLTTFWKKTPIKKAMVLGSRDTLIKATALKHEFKSDDVKITVVNSGHMSHIEDTQGTIQAITRFFTL